MKVFVSEIVKKEAIPVQGPMKPAIVMSNGAAQKAPSSGNYSSTEDTRLAKEKSVESQNSRPETKLETESANPIRKESVTSKAEIIRLNLNLPFENYQMFQLHPSIV